MQVYEQFNIKDRTALVTGGSGVLCGTMARALAQAGCRVAVLGRTPAKVEAMVETIRSEGGDAIGVAADVLSVEDMERARDEVLEAFGRIDILVNGAGGNHPDATTGPDKTFFDLDIEAVRHVFDLNLVGTILPSKIIGAEMAKQGSGAIVNISSAASFHPMTRVVSYAAAKAGVNNFTEWLATYMAKEYSPNIRVNAIAPGFFIADQNRALLLQPDGQYTARGQQIVDHTPLGRFGEAEELVGALIWLVSDASRFVTGSVVVVDGGFRAYTGV
ncbi:MAG: SDR family oxidoreductase [Firmicutes bacterium]|nr:SDR family oxidoreductase [Bacillota bacterium]